MEFTSENLILTGWGRSEYAAAAAVALRAVGEADVLGVSKRRLSDVLAKEAVGRKAVYVMGVGLGNEAEAFAKAAQVIAESGVQVSYLSSLEIDSAVRKLLESSSVSLGVFPKAESIVGVESRIPNPSTPVTYCNM